MPTVPKLTGRGGPTTDGEVLDRGPSPKLAKSTPQERERDNPRLSIYDDLIRATAHLPAEERLAARLPAIMSDPAAWGGGEDLRRVVDKHVPGADDAESQ